MRIGASNAELPKALADDLLDHAAGTTAHEAGLMLLQGVNRLAGPAEFRHVLFSVRRTLALAAPRLSALIFLSLCTLGPTGCFLLRAGVEGGDPYVKGNLFDEAIWGTNGGVEAVARDTPKQIERLLGADRSMAAIETILTKHGAKCEPENRSMRCSYRKTRLRGKMADILTEYHIEVTTRARGKNSAMLLTCVTVARNFSACVQSEIK